MKKQNRKNTIGKYPKQPVFTTQDQHVRKACYQATDAGAKLDDSDYDSDYKFKRNAIEFFVA